jgi:hypothetical protein
MSATYAALLRERAEAIEECDRLGSLLRQAREQDVHGAVVDRLARKVRAAAVAAKQADDAVRSAGPGRMYVIQGGRYSIQGGEHDGQ